jgi:hypothetical protein
MISVTNSNEGAYAQVSTRSGDSGIHGVERATQSFLTGCTCAEGELIKKVSGCIRKLGSCDSNIMRCFARILIIFLT